MITQQGEAEVGRVLANYLGTHIVVGVGSTAPSINDKQLAFEVYRGAILARSYDPTTNILVYKTALPEHLSIFINEVGIISSPSATANEGVLTRFDNSVEEWTGGTFTTSNVRVGNSGLTVALGQASTSAGTRVALSETRQSDIIQVAFFGAGGNVEVRLGNTTTDYFSFTFPATAGYNVYSVPIYSMTKTGTPDINGVTDITVIHSGSGSVTMDAIRVSAPDINERMIVRQLFVPAKQKIVGMPLDIEVPLEVTL